MHIKITISTLSNLLESFTKLNFQLIFKLTFIHQTKNSKPVKRLQNAVHDVTHSGSLLSSLLAFSYTAKYAANEYVNKADLWL